MRLIKVLSLIVILSVGGVMVHAKTASADPARVVVTYSIEGSDFTVGSDQLVTWRSENFPKGAFVNINLIKKVSDSPVQYELVRQIAEYSVNDGEESWKPERSDRAENLFLEVTCAGSSRFKDGCMAGKTENQFAVHSTFGSNLAGAIGAFLSIFGK